MSPPFPICCLTGLISADAAGTAAAFFTGLATGGSATALSQILPLYKDPKAPLADLVADHKKRTAQSRGFQKKLVLSGLAATAAAAGINHTKEAAVPLALAAGLTAGSVALTVFLIQPLNEKIQASPAGSPAPSPSKKAKGPTAEEEAEAREALQRYAGLSTLRTSVMCLAFGASLCGVLLLNKKK